MAIGPTETIAAFRAALESIVPYDMVCFGPTSIESITRGFLKAIRKMEKEFGIRRICRTQLVLTLESRLSRAEKGNLPSELDGVIETVSQAESFYENFLPLSIPAGKSEHITGKGVYRRL